LKPVRFTARAESDMRSIIRYYEDIAPGLSARIVEDVRARIERLRHFPKSGRRIAIGDLHQVLSPRYRFKIAYRVMDDEIDIVGIFRLQNREV
jgi:plasmid stabilization system protein ParE